MGIHRSYFGIWNGDAFGNTGMYYWECISGNVLVGRHMGRHHGDMMFPTAVVAWLIANGGWDIEVELFKMYTDQIVMYTDLARSSSECRLKM